VPNSFSLVGLLSGALLIVAPHGVMAQSAVEYQLKLGSGSSLPLPDALGQAVQEFFGPSTGQSFSQLSVSDVFGSGGRRQTSGSSFAVSVSASQTVAMYGPYSLAWDAELALGAAGFYLPDGAGPFSDPINIDFEFVSITPRIYAERDFQMPNDDLWGVRAGIGSDILRARTFIRSSFFDVQSIGTFQTNFAFGEVFYRFDAPGGTEIFADVELGANDTIAFGFGTGIEF